MCVFLEMSVSLLSICVAKIDSSIYRRVYIVVLGVTLRPDIGVVCLTEIGRIAGIAVMKAAIATALISLTGPGLSV